MLKWKVEKMSLIPVELEKTLLFKKAEENNKDIESFYEFTNKPLRFEISHKIPKDAFLLNDEGSTIIRNNQDTELGSLIEILIPRKKKSTNLHLKGKRYHHLLPIVQTNTKLVERVEDNDD